MGENIFNYEAELAKLHIELVHLQEWVKKQGLKVVVSLKAEMPLVKVAPLNGLLNLSIRVFVK